MSSVRGSSKLNEEFMRIDSGTHTGVLKKGYGADEVLKTLQGKGFIGNREISQRIYVKNLNHYEFFMIPAERFANSFHMWSRSNSIAMAEPLGLIYEAGKGSDFIASDIRTGYFLAQSIRGDRLIHRISQMEEQELECLFSSLRKSLKDFADDGIYPFDFAPRDIVLHDGFPGLPVIVDTENVEILNPYSTIIHSELWNKQRNQFVQDYKDFLDGKDVQKYTELIFSE